MLKGSTHSSIPPLWSSGGSWMLDAQSKADTFASAWSRKFKLPDAEVNEFTTVGSTSSGSHLGGFLPIRVRNVGVVLRNLRECSSTGEDGLSARVLKKCHAGLALPIAMLARAVLQEGVWPHCWRHHWLFPLHKRKETWNCDNYRGIHITPQISKVLERILERRFLPYLVASGAYGPNQFAYTPQRGLRDSLAYTVLQWIAQFDAGKRLAVYLSDVSGAFDRVDANRLLSVLQAQGVHPQVFKLLSSWLEDRSATVIVDGTRSAPFLLRNSVFQGTVLGPPLWNAFFESARQPVNQCGYKEAVFADDLVAHKVFESGASDRMLEDSMKECQAALHRWGAANRVCFDAGKEQMIIIDKQRPSGESFKMLGVLFDTRLSMAKAVHQIAGQARSRLRCLLRLRRFYSRRDMVIFYKSQVLSYVEFATPALYHAHPFLLHSLDDIQDLFLDALGLTPLEALKDFKLAPLNTRRDIAMMGLIHRVVLGIAPVQFNTFIRPAAGSSLRSRRSPELRHARQLHDPLDGSQGRMVRESVLGLIYPYNLLPQRVVDAKTTSTFQRHLQSGLTRHSSAAGWSNLFTSGFLRLSVAEFQGLFSSAVGTD